MAEPERPMVLPNPDLDAWLRGPAPPDSSGPALRALWWAHRGEWGRAHGLVQDDPGADAAWVHAWLHRSEGDDVNAAYWYRRAGRPDAGATALDAEWRSIATALLTASVTPRL